MKKIFRNDAIKTVSNRKLFHIYAQDLSKLGLLTTAMETRLFKCLKDGDLSVRNEIYEKNLRFVIFVAKNYDYVIKNSCLEMEDLICEGNIGLSYAIDKFDVTYGMKFITYAVHWIKSSIVACIYSNNKSIKIPAHSSVLFSKLNKIELELESMLCRQPSQQEIIELAVEREIVEQKFAPDRLDSFIKSKSVVSSLEEQMEGQFSNYDLIENVNAEIPSDRITSKQSQLAIFDMFNKMNMPEEIQNYFKDYSGFNAEGAMGYTEMGKKYNERSDSISRKMQTWIYKIRKYDRLQTGEKLENLLLN